MAFNEHHSCSAMATVKNFDAVGKKGSWRIRVFHNLSLAYGFIAGVLVERIILSIGEQGVMWRVYRWLIFEAEKVLMMNGKFDVSDGTESICNEKEAQRAVRVWIVTAIWIAAHSVLAVVFGKIN